jgi:RsiW-degrading membrane proteinase PrsW (M82 family)
LLSGIVLLFLVERTLIATSNPNYAPSVILLGAFLVPVTFVTYLYERLPSWDVSLPALAVCFLWGGVLGTVVAGTLEFDVARSLGFLPKLAIGEGILRSSRLRNAGIWSRFAVSHPRL